MVYRKVKTILLVNLERKDEKKTKKADVMAKSHNAGG